MCNSNSNNNNNNNKRVSVFMILKKNDISPVVMNYLRNSCRVAIDFFGFSFFLNRSLKQFQSLNGPPWSDKNRIAIGSHIPSSLIPLDDSDKKINLGKTR